MPATDFRDDLRRVRADYFANPSIDRGGQELSLLAAPMPNVMPQLQLPHSRPEDDAAGLWALQKELLDIVQHVLGPRDASKTVCQPVFHEHGPKLRNTPNLDGAFVELSPNARGYWPTVVYEMAHETVHLLDPTVSHTNWLEEGVAVEFSIFALAVYGLPSQTPASGPYFEALQMVRALPSGALPAGKAARAAAGALNSVTFRSLSGLFPSTDAQLLQRLAEQCVPR